MCIKKSPSSFPSCLRPPGRTSLLQGKDVRDCVKIDDALQRQTSESITFSRTLLEDDGQNESEIENRRRYLPLTPSEPHHYVL